MWQVYILKCVDKTLYTGISNNLERRLNEHNESKLGAKYTKARRPVRIVYSCNFENRSEALKEEVRIKRLARVDKIKLIKNKK